MIVPVQLGCCTDTPRCVLCPPAPPPPSVEVVRALVRHYREERLGPDEVLLAGFYGGPPPSEALLSAVEGIPSAVRVRPDLLSREDARRLVEQGVESIELDALTLDDAVLKSAGRRYRGALVLEMLRELRHFGVRVGVILAPGLPRSNIADSLRDAEQVASLVDTARVHPVLVLEHAKLVELHLDGLYRPLALDEAVAACRAMLDVLEAAGVEVIRIGQQPGPDGLGRALAGPRHSALRQLVEASRVRDILRRKLDGARAGAHIVIRCAPADETRTRGPYNQHVRDLRAEFELESIRIAPDATLSRGQWIVDAEGKHQ